MKREIIKNLADFKSWWEENKADIIAFDTECDSLSYLHLNIIGFSICNGKSACYVNLFENKSFAYILRFINDIFWNCKKVILHNSAFDLKVLYKYNINKSLESKIIDTMVASFLLDENRRIGLKFLAGNVLGRHRLSYRQIESKYGVGSPEFFDYAMDDAVDTWDLWKVFEPQLEKEQLTYLFEEVEMPFQFVIRDMEINGVGVDCAKLLAFDDKCRQLLLELEIDLLKTLGINPQIQRRFDGSEELLGGLGFNSSRQMVAVVEKLGLKITEKTKPSKTFPEGQKSIGVVTLLRLRGKHPFIEKLHYYKYVRHLHDAFVKKLQPAIEEDGRIRGSFKLAKSGRLRMRQPNLQQNPNDEKYGFKSPIKFREIFVPDKDNVYIIADYSGQELRNLGEVTKDEKILSAFENKLDLHLLTASHIFNLGLTNEALTEGTDLFIKAKDTYKTERHRAKNGANFPIIYGTSDYGISKRQGVSLEEAKRWMSCFFELYPNVKKNIDLTRIELENVGYVKTLMGRKRRFPFYKSGEKKQRAADLRAAFNHKIQGVSADQMKIALIKLSPKLKKWNAKILLQVHDSVVIEIKPEYAEDCLKETKYVLENAVAFTVQHKVDIKIQGDLS